LIISCITGGLGNQMFQYSASYALALRHKTTLLLDLSIFEKCRLQRKYELDRIFDCEARIASKDDIQGLIGWRAHSLTLRILRRRQCAFLRGRHLLFEPEPYSVYWSQFPFLPDSCILIGYWQSEKYFCDIEDVIRREFSFKRPLTGSNINIASDINSCNSVSLHVRRGEYVSDSKTAETLGLCSLEYYQQAMEFIAGQIDSPKFFVFSDDMSWVRDNLKVRFPCSYVDQNCGSDSYIDMQLMSLCQHHIIANSSFSWWGAWLNPNPDKIVVAPKVWFANGHVAGDILPESWVAM
jgi:Glycosyl transferase family 11